MVKFSPMAASGKINKNFTLTKNAHYTASTSIQYIYWGTLWSQTFCCSCSNLG